MGSATGSTVRGKEKERRQAEGQIVQGQANDCHPTNRLLGMGMPRKKGKTDSPSLAMEPQPTNAR